MHYAHACTTAWANNAHTDTHTHKHTHGRVWAMTDVINKRWWTSPLFRFIQYFNKIFFFGIPTWWSISTISINIIDLVNMISFFAGWLISTRSFPTWRSTCLVTHDDVNTVCWQQSCIQPFFVQPFLCQQNCSLNSCGHSTGNKGSSTSSTCSAGQTTSFGVTTLLWIWQQLEMRSHNISSICFNKPFSTVALNNWNSCQRQQGPKSGWSSTSGILSLKEDNNSNTLVWRHQRGWGDLQHWHYGWWSNQQMSTSNSTSMKWTSIVSQPAWKTTWKRTTQSDQQWSQQGWSSDNIPVQKHQNNRALRNMTLNTWELEVRIIKQVFFRPTPAAATGV